MEHGFFRGCSVEHGFRFSFAGIVVYVRTLVSPMTTSTSLAEQPKPAAVDVSKTSSRLLSLDVYRGLVIVVMTFVNYLSPVKEIPAWAKHWPENLEGYTFVDVVFPAF